MNKKRKIGNIILFIILCLGAFIILVPIAWMISTDVYKRQVFGMIKQEIRLTGIV